MQPFHTLSPAALPTSLLWCRCPGCRAVAHEDALARYNTPEHIYTESLNSKLAQPSPDAVLGGATYVHLAVAANA